MKPTTAKTDKRKASRARRHVRVRSKISGTAERPRVNVFRGTTTLFVQLIDDAAGKTLASVHSKQIKKVDAGDRKAQVAVAFTMGKQLADKAKKLGITTVVFDRGGYAYHGRVQAIADGAREGGLQL